MVVSSTPDMADMFNIWQCPSVKVLRTSTPAMSCMYMLASVFTLQSGDDYRGACSSSSRVQITGGGAAKQQSHAPALLSLPCPAHHRTGGGQIENFFGRYFGYFLAINSDSGWFWLEMMFHSQSAFTAKDPKYQGNEVQYSPIQATSLHWHFCNITKSL